MKKNSFLIQNNIENLRDKLISYIYSEYKRNMREKTRLILLKSVRKTATLAIPLENRLYEIYRNAQTADDKTASKQKLL
ncbi:MAG: hypothetical protein LBR09_03025 [Endomicrobium sp.]|jgi:hypothetical protein|nr:hypothetical protein [Endomicrobium sp.]